MSPGGVDMRTMRYVYNQTDLSIGGEGDDGLSLIRSTPMAVPQPAVYPFGNFSFNWDVSLDIFRVSIYSEDTVPGPPLPPGNDYQAYVNYGGRTQTFRAPQGGWYQPMSRGPYDLLSFIGDQTSPSVVYKFSDDQFNVVTFQQLGTVDGAGVTGFYPTSYTRPNGTTFTFDYTAYSTASGTRARVRSIVSSRGYAIVLESSGGLITKACTLNLALTTLPANHLCPANAAATVTYAYSGGKLASVTGPDGSVSSFIYGTSAGLSTMGFVKPGASTPWLTNTLSTANDELGYPYDIVSSQSFADGHTYSYTPKYTPFVTDRPASIAGGVYVDNLGNQTRIVYGFPIVPGTGAGSTCTPPPCSPQQIGTQHYQQTSGPQTITDPLQRVTTMDYCDPAVYCAVTLLQSYTDPEGIKVAFTYDDWRNVTKAVRNAKPGSGLSGQVTTATYDCTYMVSCAKPTSVTDPKGSTTNYSYDPVHGGILTESDPPDASGIRPVKRSAYVQRYAWVSDGAGGYVHASAPVWLLSSEKTCRSTATVGGACAGGANDEIVTAYDYGPDSGPNNLLLRGITVTAVAPNAAGALVSTTLRTCYGYDAQGNRISETKPRAGLTVCP